MSYEIGKDYEQKFNVGDGVWYASFERVEEHIVCDDCKGQRYLTVIMGDKSEVTIECTGCQSGYDPPRGYNIVYNYIAKSKRTKIERIEIAKDGIEYYTSVGCGKNRVFDTEEEANKKAEELGERYYTEQKNRLENLKENNKRTWSWNATYHRRQIKEAQKQIEYHTEKLNVAKVKTKDSFEL